MVAKVKSDKITEPEFDIISKQILDYRTMWEAVGTVVCPRCRKNILLNFVGNSYSAQCEDDECIHYTIRGL